MRARDMDRALAYAKCIEEYVLATYTFVLRIVVGRSEDAIAHSHRHNSRAF